MSRSSGISIRSRFAAYDNGIWRIVYPIITEAVEVFSIERYR